jgi:glycerophosphoryl diester phosphodiesterase
MAPALPTVLLMSRVPLRFRDGTLPPRVGIAGPSLEVVKAHPGYVGRVQRAGNRIYVWTVDTEDDIRLMLDLGIDAIISNHPRRVLRRLAER